VRIGRIVDERSAEKEAENVRVLDADSESIL
jgi:hypothetical protein